MYSKDDPKWVQADSVVSEMPDHSYVTVTAYGEEFKNCRMVYIKQFS